MKFHLTLTVFLFCMVFSNSFAQNQSRIPDGIASGGWGDGEAARQYVQWAEQEIRANRWANALAGLERAGDFANVSSDISYLLALARSHEGKSRLGVIEALNTAIETNRWVNYDENQALLLKAQQQIAMRRFSSALATLDQITLSVISAGNNPAADAVMLRLLAFKGMAEGLGGTTPLEAAQALPRFRSLVLSAMDRFPRDPRPLKIFFEYARNRMPEQSELPSSDQHLMELALRRLPFVLESDPELAWTAAPFLRDPEDARRLVSSYRAGAIPNIYNRDFYPGSDSIPIALNLGLIDDASAINELFSGNRGINSPLPPWFAANVNPVLGLSVVRDTYNLLRSEEGRNLFTQRLLSFTGIITSDDDEDGFIDSYAVYVSGVVTEFFFDRNQENIFDFHLVFSSSGVPQTASVPITGRPVRAEVKWERYPFAEQVSLDNEIFSFRPADFQYAPVSFITIGGSRALSGLAYPVVSFQYMDLTRRTLVSFCSSITRPSVEFNGAIEQIFLERAVVVQAVETLNEKQISITEFVNGLPVIQYLDWDLDGRMETIRRFHRPWQGLQWPEPDEIFNYRLLLASSESDWNGDGRFITGEVYLQDGSVVYLWDMDGSGAFNYSETEHGNRE